MRKSAINEFEIDDLRKENGATKLMLRNFYQTKKSITKPCCSVLTPITLRLFISAMHRHKRRGAMKRKGKRKMRGIHCRSGKPN